MTLAEYRQMLKKAHLCRECKKQDAYTLNGRTYCFECAEKMRTKKAEARSNPEKREKMLEQKRAQLQRYREQHKCTRCGRKVTAGIMCGICRAIARREVKKSRNAPARVYGVICWQCNKKPVWYGLKLCEDCYKAKIPISLKNLEKSRENHPWKGSFICNK